MSNGTCALCSLGMYSMQAGATVCFACMQGSFADREGMSQCVLSGMGAFVPSVGQSGSIPCSPGSFQYVGGSSSCLSCASGFYQSSYGSTVCEACAPGTYHPKHGASACYQCASGAYSSVEGGTGCVLCSAGSFQAILGGSSCVACPVGTYLGSSGGSSSEDCTDCRVGTYSTVASAAFCLDCSAGSFTSEGGKTSCDACPRGTYQPVLAQSECLQCQAGTYGVSTGALASDVCVSCKSGTYSTSLGGPDGAVCIRCPPGQFSANLGATTREACQPCSKGTVSAIDGTHCPACEDGTFCPAGSVVPILCQNEHLMCNGTHLLAHPGFLAVLSEGNCTGVIPCPHGTVCHLKDPLRAGILPVNADSTAGPPHFVVYAPGQEQIKLNCPWSTFFYGVRRVDQLTPEEQLAGVLFRLQALDCPAGTFLLDDGCAPCPAGTFSTTWGAYSRASCLACPVGTFGALPGISACLACASGGYQSLDGATACVECSPGTYQEATHASACDACASGTFLSRAGGTACLLCDAGKVQPAARSTSCSSCATTDFSSSGDAVCTRCGPTPSVQEACPLSDAPSEIGSFFYLSVRGEQAGAHCLGVGVSQFSPGRPAHLALPVDPLLHQDVLCHHTLSVMGRPELSRSWTIAQRRVRKAASLRVLPYGVDLNLALCEREGLAVSFVLQDEHGGYEPDLVGAEATLAFVAPEGKDLLFWTTCEQLPRREVNGSGILIGTCTAHNFCPVMNVLARVTVSWPGGISVRGEHALRVERARICPPLASWTALVELDSPGMRFSPGDLVNATIRVVSPPEGLASFSFSLQLRKGFRFVSFESEMSTSFVVNSEQVLSVEGDSTMSSSSPRLGVLVFRVGAVEAGVLRALRVDVDSFSITLRTGRAHTLRVRTQGFACRLDGALLVLVSHSSVYSLVARPRVPALVDWQSLQTGAPQFLVGIEAVGVWNTKGKITAVSAIQCAAVTSGVILVHSCDSIGALAGKSGGMARIRVRAGAASTHVDLPVFVPWNASVVEFPGPDGLSGRFKVLARLRSGSVLDRFQAELDVTPYLGELPARGVILQGEEWVCRTDGPFTVGAPVLFRGMCLASRLPGARVIPYFFPDAGHEVGMGRFTLGPSFLHPSVPSGVLLLLGGIASAVSSYTLDGRGRVEVGEQMRLTLSALGMSPCCIRLQEGYYQLPVLPASPASLRVVLETSALVTQHDIWGLLPSSTGLAEAWLDLSDGTALDVRLDPRLFWETDGDLEVVPGEGVRSRGLAGNFTVQFGVRGIPCLRAVVALQVHPYSTRSAMLVCKGCPDLLAARDDPMARQFPDRFPSSILASAFVVQYLLVDGSVKEKPCHGIVVSGAGILEDGILRALEQGVVVVTTDAARGKVEIRVISRWLQGCALLCNGQSCADPELRLTVPGDAAAQAPFSYSPVLAVSLNLTIFGSLTMHSPLIEGMHLEANGVRTTASSVPLLASGELHIALVMSDEYLLTQEIAVVRVDVLQSLVISGPSVLFQIHCSRFWEQGLFTVTATLSDGASAGLSRKDVLQSDGRVILPSGTEAGVFGARMVGEGWVQASFGNRSVVYAVQATQTSKYYTSIRVQRLPIVWTARIDEAVSLAPELQPDYQTRDSTEIHRRILRWSASVPGVVRFSNDSSSLSLLSDFYGKIQLSCVLLACMGADMLIDQQEFWVNLAPSVSGQIDLGQDVGQALTPVAVGEVMTIPVFMFAEARLRSYLILIAFDHLGIVPLDCLGGELFQSVCSLSDSTDLFEASGNFSLSQRSGRILVAQVRGRVTMDTVSQVHVLVRAATFGDGQQVGPVGYRFSVRAGSDRGLTRFTQPYLNRVGPLISPPLLTPVYPGEDEPAALTVCCDLVVAQTSARLSRYFPSVFVVSAMTLDPGNVSLDAVDPRVQFLYDATLLEYEPEQGIFRVLSGVSWASGRTGIDVIYTHPGTLGLLRAHVVVRLAEVASLRLTPAVLEIRRVHCAQTVFRNATIRGELVLSQELGVVPLWQENIQEVSVGDLSIVELLGGFIQGSFLVRGLSPGVSDIRVDAYRLQGSIRVIVLKESDRFDSYDLQTPLILSACLGQSVPIPVTGRLEDGTVLTQLERFLPAAVVNTVGPVQAQPGNLSLLILGNTALDDSSLGHVSLHMPACQGSPEITVQAILRTRLVACVDPYHQAADVEISPTLGGGVVLRLVGREIMAFYVHVRVDPSPDTSCRPLVAGDCSVGQDSTVIVAGVAPRPTDTLEIAVVSPVGRTLWGFVEVFAGISPIRVPVIAGRIGGLPFADPVKTLMPVLPVVDTAVLSRSVSDDQARYTLDLMTDRQRLVDPRFYSHSGELSLMFRVTDRFLAPDDSRTQIHVIFPASSLPVLPDAVPLPGGGQRVPAPHVSDGWYAVQWQGSVPAVTLDLEFHVATSTSRRPQVWPWPGITLGLPFRDCPRAATQHASFLSRYRVFLSSQNFEWVAMRLVCAVHVPRRRIRFSGFNGTGAGWGELSLELESFIRVQEVREQIMSPWFKAILSMIPPLPALSMIKRGRVLPIPESPVQGGHLLAYINDTKDGPTACPPGVYFSRNGTYVHLPMHSVAGEDCYGMKCVHGYRLQDQSCVPEDISMDVVWICVTVISSFVSFVVCIFCCVRMARVSRTSESPKAAQDQPMGEGGMPVVMEQDPFDDVFPEHEWGCRVQLDDYSSTMLDDDCSLHSPLPFGSFRR